MEVKWANVTAFALVILLVVLALKLPREITAALDTVSFVWESGVTESERLKGFIVLGFLCVFFVAVLKLILANKN